MSTHPNGLLRLGAAAAAAAVLAAAMALTGCGGGGDAISEPNTPPMATATPDEPEGTTEDSATLDVMSGQPTEIKLDGKSIGKTPITNHKVAPGAHEVTFMFTEKDTPTLTVTLAAGQAQTVKLDPPPPIREGAKPDAKPEEKK